MKHLFLSVLLLLLYTSGFSQSKKEKTWGGKGYDGGFSTVATSDGGYIMTGLTNSFGDTTGDIFVFKLNANGDTAWTMQYGGTNLEGGNGVIETKNGDFLITGHTESFGAGDCDAFFMLLDKNGKKKWFKTYGGISDDIGEAAVELPGGGFILVGNTANFGAQDRDLYFVRTDNKGDTIWTRHYGGWDTDYGYKIKPTADGSFIAVGMNSSKGAGMEDGYIIKIDTNGNKIWDQTYGGKNKDRFYDIQPTKDSGFIVAGFRTDETTGLPLGWLMKLDSKGAWKWDKTYGQSYTEEKFYAVNASPDGKLLATGYSKTKYIQGNICIFSADMDGSNSATSYFGPSGSYGRSIAARSKTSFMIAGSTNSMGDTSANLYYNILDSNTTGVFQANGNLSVPKIYPNPATGQTTLYFSPDIANRAATFHLTSITGKEIKVIRELPGNEIKINLDGMPAGVYIYHLDYADGNVYCGKLLVK